MNMGCIDPGGTSVRSGGAGDALASLALSRRGNRASWVDPQGRVFKALGRRLPPLAMLPASRRSAILAQDLDNAVQPVFISQTDSSSCRDIQYGIAGPDWPSPPAIFCDIVSHELWTGIFYK